MKQQRNSCFPSKVAGMALALIGLCGLLGLGLTGEAQASPLALSQAFAPAACMATGDGCRTGGTGGYDAIRINRGSQERKCPRGPNDCDKQPPCPPDVAVCPKPS